MDAFVARQPVFNRRKKLFGYELLFRGPSAAGGAALDGDTATSSVLSNSFFVFASEALHNILKKKACKETGKIRNSSGG